MTAEVRSALIAEGAGLDAELKAKKKRLEDIKAQLTTLEPGIYAADNGRTVQIIQPGPAIKPKEEQVEAAREMIGDEPTFKKLFERITTWKAVKAFREIALAILPTKKAQKIIEICEVDSTPYVIFG
jgi:hypothetical protein